METSQPARSKAAGLLPLILVGVISCACVWFLAQGPSFAVGISELFAGVALTCIAGYGFGQGRVAAVGVLLVGLGNALLGLVHTHLINPLFEAELRSGGYLLLDCGGLLFLTSFCGSFYYGRELFLTASPWQLKWVRLRDRKRKQDPKLQT